MSHNVTSLVSPKEYRESRAHIFPSKESFTWFARQGRKDLVEAGALVVIAGRHMVDPAKADEVVLAVGREAAKKAAA